MAHPRTTSCDHCRAVINLDGRVGRPPIYCGPECRRAGYAASERARRERRKREIARLRELVSIYESALAA
jgi:hypothetical protein